MCPTGTPEQPLITDKCQTHYRSYRAKIRQEKKQKKQETDEWKEKKRKEMNDFLNKSRKRIPKVSAKQLDNLKKYRKVRDEFMANKTCEAKLKGCTIKATDLHHAKGKIGDLLTDKRYFKALCRNCHSYIEVHPVFAKENGFSLNRL